MVPTRTGGNVTETLDWPAIVREHGPLVWRTALRILGDDSEAADCYQETFISALRPRDARRS